MEPALCARIDSRLRENPMGNIMALKFLHLRGQIAQGDLLEDGDAWVSWFHYAPQAFAYDAGMYGQRTRIVYWNANDWALALSSVAKLPVGSVVKVSTEPCLSLARQHGTEAYRFVWLSTDHPVSPQGAVEIFDVPSEEVAVLSAENGYDEKALNEQTHRGCRWFLARLDAKPQAVCFVQPNDGPVWEVSGVLVRPKARGRGLAKAVVSAAVNDLLHRGRVPRYFVNTENTASLGVARSIGLTPRGETVHFLFG